MKKNKKYLDNNNHYYWIIFAILISLTIITEYYYWSYNLQKTIELAISAILMLVATFAGIFTPLLIERQNKKKNDRRLMVFSITSVWEELRSVQHKLKVIEENFKFKELIEKESSAVNLFSFIQMKYESLYPIVNQIESKSYQSMIDSGRISLLKTDDLYNSIVNCYENIEHFRSLYLTIRSAFALRAKTLPIIQAGLDQSPYASQIKNEAEIKLKQVLAEIRFAKESTRKTLAKIEKEVSSIGPKMEEVLKNYGKPPKLT